MFDWKWSGLVRVFFRIFFRATWDRKWPAHRAEWTPRSAQFGTSSKRGFGWELWFPDLATQAVWCLPCFQTVACLMLLRSTPIAKWPGKRNSQRTSLQNWQNPAIDFRSVLDRFILRSIGFTQGKGIAHHCPLCGAPTLTYTGAPVKSHQTFSQHLRRHRTLWSRASFWNSFENEQWPPPRKNVSISGGYMILYYKYICTECYM